MSKKKWFASLRTVFSGLGQNMNVILLARLRAHRAQAVYRARVITRVYRTSVKQTAANTYAFRACLTLSFFCKAGFVPMIDQGYGQGEVERITCREEVEPSPSGRYITWVVSVLPKDRDSSRVKLTAWCARCTTPSWLIDLPNRRCFRLSATSSREQRSASARC